MWWKSGILTGIWTFILLLSFSSVTLAQRNRQIEAPILNPLEIPTNNDPLLPNPPVERPLSPLEEYNLREALAELNNEANAEINGGNKVKAFEIWYREIRLRRVLGGPLEEVPALGRVGEIAWSKNYKPETQLITSRLKTIQQEAEAKGSLDKPLLHALGKAYLQVRVPGQALAIYNQILADSRQRQDEKEEEEILKIIAQLHLAWFDYAQAAGTYQELLNLAQTNSNHINEIAYIEELINIYNQSRQREKSLLMKEQLLALYRNPEELIKVPGLKIAIATDYEALDKAEKASEIYQEAYKEALALNQFAEASDALERLGKLYSADDQPEVALQVYEVLVWVEQQSYNAFGLMNAYDQMGQIYLDQKNYVKALEYFQQGLDLAKLLQHQETYFARQIERVNQEKSP
ncbi:MAG TPA: hypothetical protein DEG17_12040 [Cyanobacteria bacterium UBA11149]|nr:hypothetical protein [Cyanobacteria bacterium UBA11367]HBE60569.1 hypothetical protein [Cyanobacteria bacterium UBA11366]HBK63799.1 hypothetical protein [Cyanobacteria bacterium UBA11166]HBR72906.1 hypothetical protein [Cyanobacteria bacterium UBA11159]HBS69018.1 hypothetical protein [Cyanobacteria bacterium UBA11153]HBW89577.1 hypothetical protein [Cyanobacteria bacterium UBA11149]HCA93408.1 hypothetical protein [Cyanobacteria bacterium UBA9226]